MDKEELSKSIKDISEMAGVSENIVRKVLSGDPLVDTRIKDRVLRILHEKSYNCVKGMRNKKRGNYQQKTIGIILPDVTHRFWFEVVNGVNDRLIIDEFNITIFNLGRSKGEFFEYIVDERFAGFVIIGTAIPERVLELFTLTDTKFIFIDIEVPGYPCIHIDNYKGGQLAADYLYSNGCRKVAYIGHDEEHEIQNKRFDGFQSYFDSSHKVELSDFYVKIDTDEAFYVTKQLLDGDKVDGIFYFCDSLAFMGLTAVRESGENVKVIGFDDMVMSGIVGLTTVKQPAYDIGYDGAAELIKIIAGVSAGDINKCVLPELIKRDT